MNRVCEELKIKPVEVDFRPTEVNARACYIPYYRKAYIERPLSIADFVYVFLHEIRHAWQFDKYDRPDDLFDTEKDANEFARKCTIRYLLYLFGKKYDDLGFLANGAKCIAIFLDNLNYFKQ